MASLGPGRPSVQSPTNVTELGTLPQAVGAIGARFSPDGDTMYVTQRDRPAASTTSAGPSLRSA